MIDKWIGQPLQAGGSKCLHVIRIQIGGRQHFIKHDATDKGIKQIIIHIIPLQLQTSQIGAQCCGGLCTVENANFSFLIAALIRHNTHRQSGLLKGKFRFHPFRAFDSPESKRFTRVNHRVLVTAFFIHPHSFRPGIAGNNTVDQGTAERILSRDPGNEFFRKLPEPGVPDNIVFQYLSIVINQFTGQDEKSFTNLLAKAHITLPKEVGKLCRERSVHVVKAILWMERNSRLGSIGYNDPQVRICGTGIKRSLLHIRIDHAANHTDHTLGGLRAAAAGAAQVKAVQALLRIDHTSQPLGQRLYHNALSVKKPLFIENIEKIIHKAAQEISLAELQDLLRCILQQITGIVLFGQRGIVQAFHAIPPFLP